MTFDSNTGKIAYEIIAHGKQVILPSELGISGYYNNIESVEPVETHSVDTTWRPVYGERAVVKDCYNQNTVALKAKGRREKLNFIIRAYNEGIAFRYEYQGNGHVCIEKESTTFNVPENTVCWFAPYAQAVHTPMPVRDWPGEAERPADAETRKRPLCSPVRRRGRQLLPDQVLRRKGGEKQHPLQNVRQRRGLCAVRNPLETRDGCQKRHGTAG